ncbi:MAG: hypothetical protein HY840_16145 [Bacteroidetes bacterium]|nr:hypothetical protein [Bacteroidota bacterium]
MNQEEITRHKLIKFIKSNDPFYLFSNFDHHSMEQLEAMKNKIEQEIKTIVEERTQANNPKQKILNS